MNMAATTISAAACLALCAVAARADSFSRQNAGPAHYARVTGDSGLRADGANGADDEREASGTSWQPASTWLGTAALGLEDGSGRPPSIVARYRVDLGQRSSVFGYVAQPGEPALGPPVSYMRRFSGIDTVDTMEASHWLDATRDNRRVLTLGYRWRNVKVEGSAFAAGLDDERKHNDNDLLSFNSTSGRLSFNPYQNWSFQLSHGHLAGLDQLQPAEDVRRTTMSATYNRAFRNGDWQTTLAWGRNVRKDQEPVMGYLLESTLRFDRTEAVFGRLERVGSDELARAGDVQPHNLVMLNRLTIGYFRHVERLHGPGFDVGAFASRHLVPSSLSAVYGDNPTSYMVFIRTRFE